MQEKKGSEKREVLLISFSISARFVFAIVRRFFSYIQLHEFEALLFSSNKGFEYYFSEELAAKTASIISSYDNPEDINTSPEGAPSKRLLAIKSDYNKVLEGNLIALEIGIKSIWEKCPRFAEWIKTIIEKPE